MGRQESARRLALIKSCMIITLEASYSVMDVYSRMPLILKSEAYERWLDPDNMEPAKIEELLHTTCLRELKRSPVSRLVNRVENNSRECMEPLKVNVSAGSRESNTKKA